MLKEVVALIINEDECREVLYAYLPDSFHSKLRILYAFDALDVAGREVCSRSADRTEIESSVLLASVGYYLCAVTLGNHYQ